YSLERSACKNADVLTSVSEITRSEILQFAQKDIDYITPNGFDTSIVPVGKDYETARLEARKKLNQVARAIHGVEFDDKVLHITNAGRSEFRNKGIDIFLSSLKQFISEYDGERQIVVWLMVPGNQSG
ncbi:MAG TPA: glycosyl transferase, partial [Bacteroidales bacterium]|nr:glycosyl transferase [Bacteroidales bacterium]